jgi:hypothetical protein
VTSGKAGGLVEEPLKAALCRTLGAQCSPIPNPGLTAGVTHCRAFGAGFLIQNRIPIPAAPPTVDYRVVIRPAGPQVNRPGRKAGIFRLK